MWWVLGLGGFIWLILAVPMAAWLLRQKSVIAPRGFTIWVAFLLWMIGSGTRLDSPDRYIVFIYRTGLYIAVTIILLYVFNMSREALPTRKIISIMTFFWMFVVVGGLMGVVFPTLNFSSPTEMLMPGNLISDEFVYDLVHPATAQIQDFLGYDQARPKAPFVYSTNWGSAYALLVPFVILGFMFSKSRASKNVIALMFVISIVPVIAGLGRGLWLSAGLGLVYAAIRLAIGGQGKALRAILILIPTMLAIVYLTPLKGLVEDRFAHPHSNERRVGLYEEAIANVEESPDPGLRLPATVRGEQRRAIGWDTGTALARAVLSWHPRHGVVRLVVPLPALEDAGGVGAGRLLVPHHGLHRGRPVTGLRVVARPDGGDHGRHRTRRPGATPRSCRSYLRRARIRARREPAVEG